MKSDEPVQIKEGTLLVGKDGSFIPIDGGVAQMRNGEGVLEGLVLTFRDITERKHTERTLAEALSKAREADDLKSQLLSTVSHELHTPLAAIKGFATMILDNVDKLERSEKIEFLKEIDAATDRLTDLIDNLLEYSRLEAGMLPVKLEPVAVPDVVAAAVAHLRMRAPNNPITLDLPIDLPRVNADPRRLRQVFDNLLNNALKYTPETCPLEIRATQQLDGDNSEVWISVSDTGPGIPEDQLESIFQPFHQAQDQTDLARGGDGLGLAICKRIIQAHRGRIWAESAIDQGVTFHLSLTACDETSQTGEDGDS